MKRTCGLLALTILAVPGMAWADNTTSANAYSLMVNGPAAEATVSNASPGTTNRWYIVGPLQPHRSYCAHTQAGANFDTSATAGSTDTILVIFNADGTTVKVANDDTSLSEPPGWGLSRACYATGDAAEQVFIRVSAGAPGTSFNVRVQMVETTLFSNWFFVGTNYIAYTLVRNTTNLSVAYGIRWRNAAGTILQNDSGVLPPNGSISLNARAYPTVVAGIAGTVDIIHLGPPDAIVASTTVISTTTGLSFDAPFITRHTW
jgi:hypothetical protein